MSINSDSARKNKPADVTAPKAPETAAKPAEKAPETAAKPAEKAPETAAKPAEKAPDAPTTEAATDTEESKEKARRGTVPTMPMAIVYRLKGRVHAVIHHPIDGTSYEETGKGEGSAKGALEDTGFRLSPLQLDGPAWLSEKVPADANLIGFASIKSFPLPPQET